MCTPAHDCARLYKPVVGLYKEALTKGSRNAPDPRGLNGPERRDQAAAGPGRLADPAEISAEISAVGHDGPRAGRAEIRAMTRPGRVGPAEPARGNVGAERKGLAGAKWKPGAAGAGCGRRRR